MAEFVTQHWAFILFGSVICTVLGMALLSLREGPPPYERRGILLSPAEINFLRTLEVAVRSDWMIFAMVRLADLVKVRAKTPKSQSWQSRINSKHVDFVLCDADSLEVKLAIELDDASQRTPDRVARDRFLSQTLSSAGLPLLRIKCEEKYETAAIRKAIEDALGIVKKSKKKW